MKRKFTFHPKDYAIGQIEKYYSDMAAKGWHLEHRNIFTSSFLQGEPKDMKYRVEVASPKAFDSTRLPEEQVAVYEDCGWEYVWGHGFIHIFRAPADSDTEEFYLDPAQQADTLKALRKQALGNILYWPVWIIIFTVMNFFTGQNMPAETYLMWLQTPQAVLGILAIMIAFTLGSTIDAYNINKLYKQMKAGIPLDHSPKKTGILPTVLKYCVIILGFAALWSPYFSPDIPMPEINEGGYVTLAELGIEIPTGNRSYLHSVGYSHKENFLCKYWYVSEDVDKEEFDPLIWLTQDVYKLKNEEKALKTANALMNTSTFARSKSVFKKMDFKGLDTVYYNKDLELVVINDSYVGYFRSIFTPESRDALLTVLSEKWA